MLVEVESVDFAIFKLKEIVVQRFFADAYFLCSFFKWLTCKIVEVPPLLNLLNNFTNFTFFGSATSLTCGLILSLYETFNLIMLRSISYFELYDIDLSWIRIWCPRVKHCIVWHWEQVLYCDVLILTQCIYTAWNIVGIECFLTCRHIPWVFWRAPKKHKRLVSVVEVGDNLALHLLLGLSWKLAENLLEV